MAQRFSTAGMRLYYAVEATAGERPTSGLTKIPEVKSIPSFNPSPETIDSTTLEDLNNFFLIRLLQKKPIPHNAGRALLELLN